MKNNAVKKIIIPAMTAGVVLLSGCQSRSDTGGLQNTSYIGSEESAAQSIHSEPQQLESSSVPTVSDLEQGSVQGTYSDISDSESEKTGNTAQSAPDSTEQNQNTHTAPESLVSSSGQEASSTDAEQSTISNTQTAPQQTVSNSEPIVPESVPEQTTPTTSETNPIESMEDNMETNEIHIKIGENTLTAVLEDNESAAALKELIAEKPLTISVSNYGGFEKVCPLGTGLPRNDVQTTAQAGDICLYNGNQIVIFPGSNSWSYTRLGKISNTDGTELKRILSGDETELTLSLKAFD